MDCKEETVRAGQLCSSSSRSWRFGIKMMIMLLQGLLCCYKDNYLVTRMKHLTTDDNHCMVAKITRDTFGPRRWFSPVSEIVESLILARLTSKVVFISWQKIIQMEISPMTKPTLVTWESIFKKESPIAIPCKMNVHWYDCWNGCTAQIPLHEPPLGSSPRPEIFFFSPLWSSLIIIIIVIIIIAIIIDHQHRPWSRFTIDIIPQDMI